MVRWKGGHRSILETFQRFCLFQNVLIFHSPGAYSETFQTSKMETFVKIV